MQSYVIAANDGNHAMQHQFSGSCGEQILNQGTAFQDCSCDAATGEAYKGCAKEHDHQNVKKSTSNTADLE